MIWFKRMVASLLAVAAGWFVLSSIRWPLMGDSSYIHYVVFLTKHGMVPYRQIIEMNMPCAYLLERVAMAVFGDGALGWRLFDFSLLALAIISCIRILKPQGKLPGFFAGILFATIHGQDGLAMSGERDLAVAVFQVVAIACLLVFIEWKTNAEGGGFSYIWPGSFGFFASLAACIKPTSFPLLIGATGWLAWRLWNRRSELPKALSSIFCGALLPIAASFIFLWRSQSTLAFWEGLRGLVAYHATLDRKPLLYLSLHAFSPILILLAFYLALFLLQKTSADTTPPPTQSRSLLLTSLLLICVAAGWLCYVLQGKGFPYQRYPFLIFLLLLISAEFFRFLEAFGWKAKISRVAIVTGVGMALFFAYRASTFSHADPNSMMLADLNSLGGSKLSGTVQCMDTVGNCIATLYEDRVIQNTGFIYDCYFVNAASPVVQNLRTRFLQNIRENPPKVIFITDSLCYSHLRTFNKFDSWPEFEEYMQVHYAMVTERRFTKAIRYWNRAEVPYSFRIYVRRPEDIIAPPSPVKGVSE